MREMFLAGEGYARVRSSGRIAATDSTGIKVTVGGGWIREKCKVHKGWIKLSVFTYVHTNEILAFVVTDERSGDAKHLPDFVDAAVASGYRIIKVPADGAYDTRKNWNGMKKRGIRFVTNIRRNASVQSPDTGAEDMRCV